MTFAMVIQSASSFCFASVQRRPTSINRAVILVTEPSRVFYGQNGKSLSPELIANFNSVKSTEKPIDTATYIPMDMPASGDSSFVFNQVADKSLGTILNSEAVRMSSVGRAATEVENNMKTEMVIGGGSPKSLQHKLNFNVQAFQALAQVEYTGFTNAAVKYKVAENKVGLEVFEKIMTNKDLVLSHTASPADRVSEVSMRWTF